MQETLSPVRLLEDIPYFDDGGQVMHITRSAKPDQSPCAKKHVHGFIALFGGDVESKASQTLCQTLAKRHREYGALRADALVDVAKVVRAPNRGTVVEKLRQWQKTFSVECAVQERTPKRGDWQAFLKNEAPGLAKEIWKTFMKNGKLVYDTVHHELIIGYDRRTGVLTLAGPCGAASLRYEACGAKWV